MIEIVGERTFVLEVSLINCIIEYNNTRFLKVVSLLFDKGISLKIIVLSQRNEEFKKELLSRRGIKLV